MESDKKILMVCLGNICRSPLAQGVMEWKLQLQGIHNWLVDSAGTGNWHIGSPPDPRSVNIARKHGLDISHQRARQFTIDDFDEFDVIIAMDQNNKRNLLNLAKNKNQQDKIFSFMEMTGSSEEDVPDPYFDNRFDLVFEILDQSMGKAIEYLKTFK